IMDGNGRWANKRLLPRVAGHRKGVESVRASVRAAIEQGVEFLTLFAFSSENWRRPADEVSILMDLFARALDQEVAKLHSNGIRFKVVGDTSRFDRRSAHGRQHAAHAHRRRQLRRPLGHRTGGAEVFRRASRYARQRAPVPARSAGALSRDGLCARAGPLHPHRRRKADFEFPPLATRVHRTVFHRHAVARFRRCSPFRGDRLVRDARAALRPYERASAGGNRGAGAGRVSAAAAAQPPGSALASALATRVVTGAALVVVVLAALFLLRPAEWGIVVLLVVVLAAREWARLIGLAGAARMLFVGVTLVIGAALLWSAARRGWHDIAIVVCGIATLYWIVIGTPAVLMRRQPASPVMCAIAGWTVLLGAFVAIAALQSRSPWLALGAMAIVWIADIAAYFTGRRFGRHKLAPQISPGKTCEGAYGGVAAVAVYALALLLVAPRAGFGAPLDSGSVALWIVFSAALAALSIVGDLHESLLKRRAGVKDSGTLLPGHGGMLDRIDALLAAMPPVALALALLQGA